MSDSVTRRFERFLDWLASPGMTGFTRVARAFWCLASLLHYSVPVAVAWFGYCCWTHDIMQAMLAGYIAAGNSLLSGTALVVASKMMTIEAIEARAAGRDLEF